MRSALIVCAPLLAVSSVAQATFMSPIANQLQNAAQTPPQQGIGAAIEIICPQGQNNLALVVIDQDLNDRCDEIVVGIVGTGDISGGLDGLQAMAPEEDSVARAAGLDSSQTSVDAISDRLSNVRAGLPSATAIAFSLDGEALSDDAEGRSAGDMQLGAWSFFLNGNFSTGDKDATLRSSGFELDSYSFTAGMDREVGAEWVVGAALAYNHIEAELDSNGGELDRDGYGLFGYASYYPNDSFYMDFVIGYNANDIDQDRRIRYTVAALGAGTTTINQVATSETDSTEFSARIALGFDFYRENVVYGPYVRVEYADVEIDGFTESIAGSGPGSGLAVQIDEQDFTSIPLVLGFQASTLLDTSWATLYPNAFVEYVREFDNEEQNITGRFVGDATRTTFALPTDTPDRNVFGVGAGLVADFGGGRIGHVSYQSVLGHKDITLHSIEAGIRISF